MKEKKVNKEKEKQTGENGKGIYYQIRDRSIVYDSTITRADIEEVVIKLAKSKINSRLLNVDKYEYDRLVQEEIDKMFKFYDL